MRFVFYFLVALGLSGVVLFGYYTLVDFALLREAYAHLLKLTPSSSVQTILLAEARQNAHRINVFADGTWTILSAILVAISLHGLATLKRAI
jgi:hypothetical protein